MKIWWASTFSTFLCFKNPKSPKPIVQCMAVCRPKQMNTFYKFLHIFSLVWLNRARTILNFETLSSPFLFWRFLVVSLTICAWYQDDGIGWDSSIFNVHINWVPWEYEWSQRDYTIMSLLKRDHSRKCLIIISFCNINNPYNLELTLRTLTVIKLEWFVESSKF